MGLKRVKTSEELTEAQKRGKKSRRKGSDYEREISHLLHKITGIEFVRTPMSGGFIKKSEIAEDFRGDILPVDRSIKFLLHMELKNQKTWNLKKWLEQAQSDCPEGKIPCVILKKANTIKGKKQSGDQQNLILLDLSDFFSVVDQAKLIGGSNND